MNDDIQYWRGKPISNLTPAELREALAETYRELERLTWLAHQQKKIIETRGDAPKKRGRPKKVEEDAEA